MTKYLCTVNLKKVIEADTPDQACDNCKKRARFSKEDSQYYCEPCGWWICV